MIRKSDIQWWILEARRNPAAAPEMIELLSQRLIELDTENERLRNELILLRRGALGQIQATAGPAPKRSDLSALRNKVDTLQAILKGQTSAEAALVFISDQLQSARMPVSEVRIRLREQRPALDRPAILALRCMLLVRPQDDVLVLTSRGRVTRLLLHQIPFLVGSAWPDAEAGALEPGERVAAALPVCQAPRFWTAVTRRGSARQFLNAQLDQIIAEARPVTGGEPGSDAPVALVDGDRGDVLLITRWGSAVRFPQHTVIGPGTLAMEVDRDDEVVAAIPLPEEAEVLVLTASGYAARRDSASCKRYTKPGGAGTAIVQAFDVMTAMHFAARGNLLYLTYSGRFVSATTADIPLQNRLSKGTRVADMSKDPAVSVAFVPGALL